jgi:molecular chaperone DnaK
VDGALKELREALGGQDLERIKRAADAVQQASYRLSEAMYKASATASATASAGAPAGAGAAGTGAPGQSTKPGDEVIDAEFKPST